MQYFKNFNYVDYFFGDDFFRKGGGDAVAELMHDLSSYVQIIDRIKQNASFYSKYTILEGDRPDQVSQKLYGTPAYHWTFYIMNDNVRTQGWPLTNNELEKKYKRDFPHQYVEVRADLNGIFKVGQQVVGSNSGASGKIIRRNLDLGVIIVDTGTSTRKFTKGEEVNSISYDGQPGTATAIATGDEYNAPYYYASGSERVDIDPQVGPGAQLTEVTYADYYVAQNNELKIINVLRPDSVIEIVNTYFQALGEKV
tara:strand:+ start:1595 stop:2356 length:762 start_codon:yes stop_codon:yes gene_type:complete